MLTRVSGRRGQGLTEYLIVLALVCLFLVFIVSEYGTTIQIIFQGSDNNFKYRTGSSTGSELKPGDTTKK